MRQLGFAFRALDENGQRRVGKRKGAGRKARVGADGRRLHGHAPRPGLDGRNHAVHVTVRVTAGLVATLRTKALWDGVRTAVWRANERRAAFRIIQVSLQRDHVHLIVEAAGKESLAAGMRASAERSRASGIGGCRAAVAWSPTGITRGRSRRRRRRGTPSPTCCATGGSTARIGAAGGWRERVTRDDDERELTTPEPRTWLLSVGWRRAGTISAWEQPGRR